MGRSQFFMPFCVAIFGSTVIASEHTSSITSTVFLDQYLIVFCSTYIYSLIIYIAQRYTQTNATLPKHQLFPYFFSL